ncbi:MAG TPA: class I SAM-dependent methyltransferase [Thermoanaerobaculia bacterium]|nr:class I SAM-dependent methyltransferase [Thermoanaerobaculia bacterium]
MTRTTLDDWNARYRNREELDDAPAPLLVDAASALQPGRALDLACGAGRNAIWLAQHAWEVVAIDGAEEAIRILREHGTAVDARVMDLETGAPLPFPDASFDLVLILFYLHRPLFAEAKRVLRRGGTIVTTARTRGRFGVAPGELRTFFEEDCDVVHEHVDDVAELVAVKR